jgi:crotonobetainyl-CoA:carnitine CoA-transferase CaiB-like acyl-CoA transferase
MRLGATPVRLERAGPLLGEHDDEILAELGLSPAERAALREAGVTGPATHPQVDTVQEKTP